MARFYLSFRGNPWPQVSWSHVTPTGEVVPLVDTGAESRWVWQKWAWHGKEGGAIIPTCSGSPRYIISKNGSLVIPQTVLADEGVYRAVVGNGAGEMTVEVPLSFLYASPCHGGCFNGGSCEEISVCLCPMQYQGLSCERFIGK